MGIEFWAGKKAEEWKKNVFEIKNVNIWLWFFNDCLHMRVCVCALCVWNNSFLAILIFLFSVYLGSSMSILESSVTPFPNAQQHKVISRCNEVSSIWAPCICSLELCIGWFPCGLKYCKGKNDNAISSNQINSSYRCGIKTCRKCNNFSYYVRQKQQCLWDEWPRNNKHKINSKSKPNNNDDNNRNKKTKKAAVPHSVLKRYFHKIFDFNLL